MSKILIIGAGPAGLSAAYILAKKGNEVIVLESTDAVGGMSKTIELWGQYVDLGPHRFFSNDTRINKLWLEAVNGEYKMVDRLTRILYNKKLFYYPLKPFNALLNLGLWEAFLCFFSFFKEQFKTKKERYDTFEEWVVARFGRKLFSIFFKSYSEKLWGISCKELDADFAAQRIKKLSLWEALKGAIFVASASKHKTLVDVFAYPIKGTGMVYENLKQEIEKMGGKVLLDSDVIKVIQKVDNPMQIESVETRNGAYSFDELISSMPITNLTNLLSGVPKEVVVANEKLRFRNTILVYLQCAEGCVDFKDNWLYIHTAEISVGRITNFDNWVSSTKNGKKETILVLEMWANDDDNLWKMEDAMLIEKAKQELLYTELVQQMAHILDGKVVRIPKCYPVYQSGYKENLKTIQSYFKKFENMQLIGRYGAFKYNNQDHSLLMGILAAENIANNDRANDLWEVNTDYDDYQERSTITESGLQEERTQFD